MTERSDAPLAVVALGGNALLKRGEPATAANQLEAARVAARVLGPVSEANRLVVTHGNGPQVGLLALKEDAFGDGEPYPLDVLDAETEGQIGYVIELELDNAIEHQDTVTVVTRVLVDAEDPAFEQPDQVHRPGLRRGQRNGPRGGTWVGRQARRRALAPGGRIAGAQGDHPAPGDPPARRRRFPRRLRRGRRCAGCGGQRWAPGRGGSDRQGSCLGPARRGHRRRRPRARHRRRGRVRRLGHAGPAGPRPHHAPRSCGHRRLPTAPWARRSTRSVASSRPPDAGRRSAALKGYRVSSPARPAPRSTP